MIWQGGQGREVTDVLELDERPKSALGDRSVGMRPCPVLYAREHVGATEERVTDDRGVGQLGLISPRLKLDGTDLMVG